MALCQSPYVVYLDDNARHSPAPLETKEPPSHKSGVYNWIHRKTAGKGTIFLATATHELLIAISPASYTTSAIHTFSIKSDFLEGLLSSSVIFPKKRRAPYTRKGLFSEKSESRRGSIPIGYALRRVTMRMDTETGCKSLCDLHPAICCGEGGIRTPGPVKVNGFQDRRDRPLCHLSLLAD